MPDDWRLLNTAGDEVLKERWQQDGSEVKNVTWIDKQSGTRLTVTPGKKVYVTYIMIKNDSGATRSFTIKDGGTTKLVTGSILDKQSISYSFTTPLVFESSIYTEAQYHSGTIIGWEE